MASFLRLAARQGCRALSSNLIRRPKLIQPACFISTSKKNKDSATLGEKLETPVESKENLLDKDEVCKINVCVCVWLLNAAARSAPSRYCASPRSHSLLIRYMPSCRAVAAQWPHSDEQLPDPSPTVPVYMCSVSCYNVLVCIPYAFT